MQPTQVTLQDLAMVVNIIDLVTKRGAFEGNELLPVGSLREKIAQFLTEQQKAAEAEAKAKANGPIVAEGEADVTDPDEA